LGLCPEGKTRDCLPPATLPSLAGDHSCSPADLFDLAQNQHGSRAWVYLVLGRAEATKQALLDAGADGPAREAARRQMHINMQADDEKYVARALTDYSHFQLARESRQLGASGLRAYLEIALDPERPANATASYVNYHWAALQLAAAARVDSAHRAVLLARALLAEAFALHFLEDSFSTGHFVGHWGSDGVRLGTHDFYARAGFEVVRWEDSSVTYVAHGDGFMADAERDIAAEAVARSLGQLLRVAYDAQAAVELVENSRGLGIENYDSCSSPTPPPGLRSLIDAPWLWEVLSLEPVPSVRDPEVARVRAENGWFVGVASSMQVGVAWPSTAGVEALDVRVLGSVRGGYGAADIVNDPINSQAFLEAGFVGEHLYGDAHASLAGFAFRARGPGKVFLVDGLISIGLAESLKGSCPGCIDWAASAASGGVWHLWAAHHVFDHVYWQPSLLRDVSFLYLKNEPRPGMHRYQVLVPFLTARSALPIKGGVGLTQSTDFYLDLGASVVWSSSYSRAFPGAFVSFSVAPRIFL
jgi:hypothetical protein